jgi:hypothetical protein
MSGFGQERRKRQPRIWSALRCIADVSTQNVGLPYESGRESTMCRTADNSQWQTIPSGTSDFIGFLIERDLQIGLLLP